MKEIIINEENLLDKEINEQKSKCRCIFINDKDQILVANYGGVYLLPGGSVDNEESIYDAIIREIKEELGMTIRHHNVETLLKISFYQKNYPKRDGVVKNRLINTYYFKSNIPFVIDQNQMQLTDNEIKSKFILELINIDDLKQILAQKKNDSPRNKFFVQELSSVLNYL
ncbi:MAG: NUDIX hydrolase [Bacilli bacterium]|nr:NUDIX hydrolase [Bacilli bacterium]MDD4809470.1 NUDIX hydrolase [Bacilli bacterium]